MSIPADALQSFPPRPYAEIRAMVQDGDLFLCQGRDPFSKLIRWSTKSPWSHIAMAFRITTLDEVLVLEAVEKIGVRCVTLATFVSKDSEGTTPYPGAILLARNQAISRDATDARVHRLARFAFDQLGDRFAGGEIAKIGSRIVAARLMGRRHTPQMLIPDDEYICSEYIAKAYEQAGLDIPWDGLGFIAPSDFANDPDLEALAQVDVSNPPKPPERKASGARDPAV